MIHDLAIYEKEPDAVRNTPEMLTEVLFGEHPRVFATMAENDGGRGPGLRPLVPELLHVGRRPRHLPGGPLRQPEARGEGHGKALLQHLAATAVERGYARVEWSVLDWNEPSINFYKKLGASPMDEWSTFRLTGEALEAFGARRSTPAADCPGLPVAAIRGRTAMPAGHAWRPRSHRPAHRQGAARIPRHAHRRALLHSPAGPLRASGADRPARPSPSSPASTSPQTTARTRPQQLPWLLYLQGGPGGRGNRLPSLGGWSKAAAKDFRILMLDQRGTGLSSAIDRNTLPLRGNDAGPGRLP